MFYYILLSLFIGQLFLLPGQDKKNKTFGKDTWEVNRGREVFFPL
jgi:hypothetical protein